MVAPVIGPIQKTISTSTQYVSRQTYKQASPIDRALPYTTVGAKQNSKVNDGFYTVADSATIWPNRDWNLAYCQNTCYDRLRGQISSKASLGAGLAELPQSVAMIAQRAKQLASFAGRLRRGDLIGAARVLQTPVPRKASVKKKFADNYLEFHFGWSPLVGDIYSAVDVLQNPIKAVKVKASASYANPDWVEYSGGGIIWTRRQWYASKITVQSGCRVSVSNPNLYLANNLGLVNPATVIWEVIPFSFVVDWFVNVEQFLSSGTDFFGLTVTDPWTTQFSRGVSQQERYNGYSDPAYHMRNDSCWYVKRTQALVKPVLSVRPFKVPGWRRAAAAAALVVQGLKR